jgi:CSLREA domain-containing protein
VLAKAKLPHARGTAARFAIVGVAALAALVLTPPIPSSAAAILVDTTADELNADGDCSLREAIEAANTDAAVDACPAGSGADNITVPAGAYVLALPGIGEDANATGDLDISSDLTLQGSGAATTIIDGAGLDRVVHILSGTVEMADVTITNGLVDECCAPAGGGGILTLATLTLKRSVVRHNFVYSGGAGGVANSGTLTVEESTVSANYSDTGTGGISGGPATINASTISGNSVISGTGGISGGAITINLSTISGNAAKLGASGISGSVTLSHSTVAGNVGYAAAGIDTSYGAATATNTIIADNYLVTGGNLDCIGMITSGGHNLIEAVPSGPAVYCIITGDATGNLIGVEPVLGPLADYGGPTRTKALLSGSPAIDAGGPGCPPPVTDQRGVARPIGAACDIGAFEWGEPGGDRDGDGCSNDLELQPEEDANLGGGRNPDYFWDFYDVWSRPDPVGSPTTWVKDRTVNVLDDIVGVAARFGSTRGALPAKTQALNEALVPPSSQNKTGYHAAFDRGPQTGPLPWNMAPPDGVINLLDDVLGVAMQFGHSCA